MLQEDVDKQIREARRKVEDASTQLELNKALALLKSWSRNAFVRVCIIAVTNRLFAAVLHTLEVVSSPISPLPLPRFLSSAHLRSSGSRLPL